MIDIGFKTVSAKINEHVEFLKNACPNCEGIRQPNLFPKQLNELVSFLSAKEISFSNIAVYAHQKPNPRLKNIAQNVLSFLKYSQMNGTFQGLTTFQTKFGFFLIFGIRAENNQSIVPCFGLHDSSATDEVLKSFFLKTTTSLVLANCPNIKSTGWQWLLENNKKFVSVNLLNCEGLSAGDLSLIAYQKKLEDLSLIAMPQLTDEILSEMCHSLRNSVKFLTVKQCREVTHACVEQLIKDFPSISVSFLPHTDSTSTASSSSSSVLGKHSLEVSKEAEAKRLRKYEKGEME